MAHQAYGYTTLSQADQIRLFRIISVVDDEIHGELTHHSTGADEETPPAYKALSYCWGDSAWEHHIKISGRSFAV